MARTTSSCLSCLEKDEEIGRLKSLLRSAVPSERTEKQSHSFDSQELFHSSRLPSSQDFFSIFEALKEMRNLILYLDYVKSQVNADLKQTVFEHHGAKYEREKAERARRMADMERRKVQEESKKVKHEIKAVEELLEKIKAHKRELGLDIKGTVLGLGSSTAVEPPSSQHSVSFPLKRKVLHAEYDEEIVTVDEDDDPPGHESFSNGDSTAHGFKLRNGPSFTRGMVNANMSADSQPFFNNFNPLASGTQRYHQHDSDFS